MMTAAEKQATKPVQIGRIYVEGGNAEAFMKAFPITELVGFTRFDQEGCVWTEQKEWRVLSRTPVGQTVETVVAKGKGCVLRIIYDPRNPNYAQVWGTPP